MPNTEKTAVHTVEVPDWLKERFDNGLAEYEADDYKKRAAVIKDNSALEITVTDLSDKTLDLAAADYCDDWYLLEPEQQQELRENIQDWIGSLLVGGVISVSPQSKTEKPFWKPIDECPKQDSKLYFVMTKYGTVLTDRYEHEINEWAGAAASYKKTRLLTTLKYHLWEMKMLNDLGLAIWEIRTAHRHTITDMAKKTGIDQLLIKRMEKEGFIPLPEEGVVDKIIAAYRLDWNVSCFLRRAFRRARMVEKQEIEKGSDTNRDN